VPDAWASKFPAPLDGLSAGAARLFDDSRMEWAFERLGGMTGKTVLELGPLEGGHSYMAQQAGAASVTAVETNTKAFLKCLVVKELLSLDRCHFLCGDVIEYLNAVDEQFDVCVACGILYHMAEPVRLLEQISRHATELIVWTQVYTDAALENKPLAKRLGPPEEVDYPGFRHRVYRHNYGLDLRLTGYCGGTRPYSNWLPREELLRALTHFGWEDVEIAFEEEGQNGPALALVARREAPLAVAMTHEHRS
jgi:SAM-dependent methyltransferase